MIFSAKCEYAMRAMLELAERAPEQAVQSRLIAQVQGIPEGFLEQIMLDLRRAELVESVRGARGGYRLSRPAPQISLAEIVQAIDGPLTAGGAWHGEHDHAGGPSMLVLGEVWASVRAAIVDVLEGMTLERLVEVTRRAAGTGPN